MPHQLDLDRVYMQTAIQHAGLSKALRKTVGAVLVTNHGVMLPGWNGTPAGLDNSCEDVDDEGNLITKPSCLHAETNAVLKAAKEGVSCLGSTLYVTLSPCESCAAMLVNAGVKRVVYLEKYRCDKGLILLSQAGVVHQLLN